MDTDQNKQEIINVGEILSKLLARKKLFYKVLPIVFVLSVAWILPEPRTYTVEVTLAPEMSSMSGGGALSDLASSFGFDIGGVQTADAIYPTLYPDIMQSTDFAINLFDVRVKTLDGEVDTTYYHYLDKKQKYSFWKVPYNLVMRNINKLLAEPEVAKSSSSNSGKTGYERFNYSKRQAEIIKKIQTNIRCMVDKKTEVITITVTDQDKLICATMADSISTRLQDYIIDYRTKKARVDVDYYEQLVREAKADYEKALGSYSGYADAHFDMLLESAHARKDALQNEAQSKLAVFNTVSAQLQTAKAKLQERMPSFTVIQPAVVPQKASGPKRMIFVLGMMVFAFIGTSLYILYGSALKEQYDEIVK